MVNDLQHSHEGEAGHLHRGYGAAVPTPGAAARVGSWVGGPRAYAEAHEHPSLRQLRAAPVKARLTDGTIVDLVKDCGCVIHDGPHWLHMDDVSRRLNQPLRDRALAGEPFAAAGLAQEEIARLREKRHQMTSHRIAELLPE